MSHITHRVLCVTSFDKDKLFICREKFKKLGLITTEIIKSEVNVRYSFFTAPSGGTAGLDYEDRHLAVISKAKDVIRSYDYGDGGNPIDFTIAVYGEFEG